RTRLYFPPSPSCLAQPTTIPFSLLSPFLSLLLLLKEKIPAANLPRRKLSPHPLAVSNKENPQNQLSRATNWTDKLMQKLSPSGI
ncbi:hypothetical protein LINPERHAP2_LOCUS41385, partial [Linum perenne]